MPEVVSRKCPNCQGNLPPLGDSEKVTCEYCGFAFDVKRTTAVPATPPPAAPPSPFARPAPMRPFMPAGVAPRSSAGGAGCVIALVGLLVVAGSGAGFWLMGSGGGGMSSLVEPAYTFEKTVGFFQVNADGVEDAVMVVRTVLSGDEMHLVAFDGATGRELWSVGDLGNYSQAYQYTFAAAANGRLLVTDFRGQVRLLDMASGLPTAAFALPDRATQLCAGATPTQVKLKLQNGNPFVVDIATGTGGPPPVIDLADDLCPAVASLEIPQTFEAGAPIQGIEDPQRVVQGDLRVAVGRRASGVRVPMAVGLGPDGQTPVWTLVVPTVAETYVQESGSDTLRFGLGGGRLYIAYSLTGDAGARVAAFDARTGARLWETEYHGWASSVDVDAMHVGPNRLVLEQFGEAEIFDAQTGALLRRVAPR